MPPRGGVVCVRDDVSVTCLLEVSMSHEQRVYARWTPIEERKIYDVRHEGDERYDLRTLRPWGGGRAAAGGRVCPSLDWSRVRIVLFLGFFV
jgi:hypothetical protein